MFTKICRMFKTVVSLLPWQRSDLCQDGHLQEEVHRSGHLGFSALGCALSKVVCGREQAQAKGQKATLEQNYDRVFAAPREAVVRNFEAVQGMLRWDGLRCLSPKPLPLAPLPPTHTQTPILASWVASAYVQQQFGAAGVDQKPCSALRTLS